MVIVLSLDRLVKINGLPLFHYKKGIPLKRDAFFALETTTIFFLNFS